jgi:hypothetical protein
MFRASLHDRDEPFVPRGPAVRMCDGALVIAVNPGMRKTGPANVPPYPANAAFRSANPSLQ